MLELAKAIVFEVAYGYWVAACGHPTREQYGSRFLRDPKLKS